MTKTAEKNLDVLELDFSRPVKIRGHRVGTLVGWSDQGEALVDHSSNPHGPLAARTTVPLDAESAEASVERGQEVVLVFEAERSDRPIILGLLQEPRSRESHVEAKKAPADGTREAIVDGRTVVFDAQDEIVLRCGEASITLRRNGRIVVKGAYVETRSKGVNRIKGGVVRIN